MTNGSVELDKRDRKRFELAFDFSVQDEEGVLITGQSVNIGLGGIKIETQQIPDPSWLGKAVKVSFLHTPLKESDFPAKVSRLVDHIMVIEWDKRVGSRFGLALNRQQSLRNSN